MPVDGSTRVLLVGDERAELDILARALETGGHPVQVVRGNAVASAPPRDEDTPLVLMLLPAAEPEALALLHASGRGDPGWPDLLVDTLAVALALRDRGTGGHAERVIAFVRDLALELGYATGGPELIELQRGALMHDIGKIGIADAILRKPGPLTAEEWVEMRLHPEYGYRMLKDISSMAGVAEMVHASHERWDGAGYPRGLAGEAIPLGARILLVADAWDAMVSDRPYRQAMSFDDARREIRVNSGTQFDPRVVEVFERVVAGWSGEAQRASAA